MKAVGFERFGGPEVLGVYRVPKPIPGPAEVRIRVHAAAVNPTDTMMRSGARGRADRPGPQIPGMDAAGVIDSIGLSSRWSIGDEVMTMAVPRFEHGGAYQEYLIAPDDSIARIPANVDIQAAATLPMNGLTAVQALELLDLNEGDTLAVTGAAGTLGSYVVPLAKQQGLVVIADAAPQDRDLVASLHPDHIVDRGPDVAERIRQICPDGVDGLIDAAVQNEQVLPAIRDGGTYASVRFWDGEPQRDITFHKVSVPNEYHSGDKLDRLRQAVEDGLLTLRVAGVVAPEDVAEAHHKLAEGGVRGRFIIDFS